MADLRVMCTGRSSTNHQPMELAAFMVTPERSDTGAAIWDARESLHGMTVESIADGIRPYRDGSRPARHVERKPVEWHMRADGGRTALIPPCPRCGGRSTPLRDTTMRRYIEGVRDTPLAGLLNVADIGSI